ncbi:MAG: Radical SAM additional 4Fe4S-binding domain-containing protein [Parcubacteria group bacterium GW2011_GWC1_45_14]|nr:MAG: Radical SAM additional 4Fe4S-binding domain-containing protein [Candidatus Moranbacteria bacterium GW2011_GWC2_45_10]KKT95486.1 MAG: Radical SAM additional 4Fe4S-binding domain-containing protein [Parcubacteria group bacterium GW2011_GWC1_45_14]
MDDMQDCCSELDAETILSITGGDPLTHPNIWEILEQARKFVRKLAVLGNPELLNEKSIGKLQSIGIDWYQVSLDGLQQTHDKIRSPGSFQRTVGGIRRLVDAGITVVVNSTISDLNLNEMSDVMRLCYNLGVGKWSFARYVPNSGTCGLTAREYNNFLKEVYRESIDLAGEKSTFISGDSLMNSAIDRPQDCDSIVGGCALGGSAMCILPDNTVMSCRRHKESSLGKWMKKGDLLELFLFHPKMQEYRKTELIEGCGKCAFRFQCRGCRALALAQSGNTFGKDPQCVITDS